MFELGSLATMIARPWIKIEFATILQGDKGIGKTFYAKLICSIVGPRYSRICFEREKFFNKYNAHLAQMKFVCLDEAFHVDNRGEQSFLKGYVTSDTLEIEYKYGPTINVPNLSWLMCNGNHQHIVEATQNERRWHCLTPSEAWMQNDSFFSSLGKDWYDHERDALAYYLLNEFDFTSFNMRKAPPTVGLLRQKSESFDVRDTEGKVKKWLFQNILMDAELPWADAAIFDEKGRLIDAKSGKEADGSALTIKDFFHQVCLKQCNIKAIDLSKEKLGKILISCFPALDDSGGSAIDGTAKTKSARDEHGMRRPRENCYKWPSLLVARQSWEKGQHGEGLIEWNGYEEWEKMNTDRWM